MVNYKSLHLHKVWCLILLKIFVWKESSLFTSEKIE